MRERRRRRLPESRSGFSQAFLSPLLPASASLPPSSPSLLSLSPADRSSITIIGCLYDKLSHDTIMNSNQKISGRRMLLLHQSPRLSLAHSFGDERLACRPDAGRTVLLSLSLCPSISRLPSVFFLTATACLPVWKRVSLPRAA